MAQPNRIPVWPYYQEADQAAEPKWWSGRFLNRPVVAPPATMPYTMPYSASRGTDVRRTSSVGSDRNYHYNANRKINWYLWSIIGALGCICIILLALAIYFGVKLKDSSTPGVKTAQVTGTINFDRTFTPALADPSSTEYKDLHKEVCNSLDKAYKKKNQVVTGCTLTGVSPGSIKTTTSIMVMATDPVLPLQSVVFDDDLTHDNILDDAIHPIEDQSIAPTDHDDLQSALSGCPALGGGDNSNPSGGDGNNNPGGGSDNPGGGTDNPGGGSGNPGTGGGGNDNGNGGGNNGDTCKCNDQDWMDHVVHDPCSNLNFNNVPEGTTGS